MFRLSLPAACVITIGSVFHSTLLPAEEASDRFQMEIAPLLEHFCFECHGANKAEAEIDLQRLTSDRNPAKHINQWQKIEEALRTEQMPPPEAKQPSSSERKTLIAQVRSFLRAEAEKQAGDPGPVTLRRLNNAEFTYSIRDLTHINELDPLAEFPDDNAAGEGFANVGDALAMSPALAEKYLAAAKALADHAVLTPEGFHFSAGKQRGDWINESLARIRAMYRRYTIGGGEKTFNLQGVVFATNGGGRIPIERYLTAIVEERAAIVSGGERLTKIAQERSLSEKYLVRLYGELHDSEANALFRSFAARLKTTADVAPIAAEIGALQSSMWKFNSVGHIGKVGGPTRWMEPLETLLHERTLNVPLTPAAGSDLIELSIALENADSHEQGDSIVLRHPRFLIPGKGEVSLKDVRRFTQAALELRAEALQATPAYLSAAARLSRDAPLEGMEAFAQKQGLEPSVLAGWVRVLGLSGGEEVKIGPLFKDRLPASKDHDFLVGWGKASTPNVIANPSDHRVRIPGDMKPRSVALHPAPKIRAVAGWKSFVSGRASVSGFIRHAHSECGNGVVWSLEHRRGNSRRLLASGLRHGATETPFAATGEIDLREGDFVTLAIGPRDLNHSCDLTEVDFTIKLTGDEEKTWNLAAETVPHMGEGNPLPDHTGRAAVWHFFTEADEPDPAQIQFSAESPLGKWLSAADTERETQAFAVRDFLLGTEANDSEIAALRASLSAWNGPLFRDIDTRTLMARPVKANQLEFGLDPQTFGPTSEKHPCEANDLVRQAPSKITIRLPASLAAGWTFHATVAPLSQLGAAHGFRAEARLGGSFPVSVESPVIIPANSPAEKQWRESYRAFRDLFPAAVCYEKIVPVDEVVTLTLYHREDDHFARLMLSDVERGELDRLWNELHFVSRSPIAMVDVFAQLMEYASQDADPKVFEPLREPILRAAEEFRKTEIAARPKQIAAIVRFHERAVRRPLKEQERSAIERLYVTLMQDGLDHEGAFRALLAKTFVSPSFLYRWEKAPEGRSPAAVDRFETACRLSYALACSLPDAELSAAAHADELKDHAQLTAQARRLLQSPAAARFAEEFFCRWLQVYRLDTHAEKSEQTFPDFAEIRADLYEETVRYFTDLIQRDRSILTIVESDHTLLNDRTAKFYGLGNVEGSQWRVVSDLSKHQRGGILGQGSFLAKQAGASRTSPILRGNWVSETLLGEKLPRPPPGVPPLPDDAAGAQLSMREITERHARDAKCSVCHKRIDPLGFALEGFDAVGRRVSPDQLGNVKAVTIDGAEINDLVGLRRYVSETRRSAFVRQFCKKLLGYCLGRAVRLSDEPLIEEMERRLAANEYRFSVAVEAVVTSSQFRMIRGGDFRDEVE